MTQARSYDEWFNRTWNDITKVEPVPGLDEIKNRMWLALGEKETIECPHCGRKFPGDAVPYSVVTEHGYKCKQNPARTVAVLLMELWNSNVVARQDETQQVNLRSFESKVAPLLSRWGFGAASAIIPVPEVKESEPEPDPNFPIKRESVCYRKDDQEPNRGIVKNHVRIGPSAARQPAYCVDWGNGDVSNILVSDTQAMKAT